MNRSNHQSVTRQANQPMMPSQSRMNAVVTPPSAFCLARKPDR
jgi:hypothetical protein